MLGTSADLQTARLIYLLLKRIEGKDERKRIIISAINRIGTIFLPVYFVSLISPDENGESRKNEALQELGFTSEDLTELQQLCITRLRTLAESSELSKVPHLAMLLFRWLHWGDETEVKEYVQKLIESDAGVLDLLVGFSTEVLSSGGGRHVEINKQNIDTFVDISLIEGKVNKIKEGKAISLSESQEESIEAFLRGGGLFDNV